MCRPARSIRSESARTASGRIPNFDRSIEELIDGGYIIVGSPSTVAEKIHDLEDRLGFGQIGVNLPVGTVSQQQTRENTDAFAKEVIPLFRSEQAPTTTVAT